jgi:hypothetical protein
MARGGRREGAGRPKGSKDRQTRTKAADREFVREEISAVLGPIVQAAITRALGLSYLVTRDAKTGKFVRVTSRTLASTKTAVEVWEKEPDMAAIRELLDRVIDRPKEQADVNVAVDWDQRIARLRAARLRVGDTDK